VISVSGLLFTMTLIGMGAQAINLTPVLVALVTAAGIALGGTVLTRRSTNRKLESEGDRLYQDALMVAEKRGQEAVATVDRIRHILEQRLDKTEAELDEYRQKLAAAEARIRELELQVEISTLEREAVLAQARMERDALRKHVDQLEAQLSDIEQRAFPGRRRRDPEH
jgi:chromosome segregation ATPase